MRQAARVVASAVGVIVALGAVSACGGGDEDSSGGDSGVATEDVQANLEDAGFSVEEGASAIYGDTISEGGIEVDSVLSVSGGAFDDALDTQGVEDADGEVVFTTSAADAEEAVAALEEASLAPACIWEANENAVYQACVSGSAFQSEGPPLLDEFVAAGQGG